MSTFRQERLLDTAVPPPAGTPFTPAALTPTLPLQIAERIGTAIVEEQFAPGERLKEVDLAAAFGVSRASIREALRLLESRGLVRILPQRGAQVTLLSRPELENLFEIRAVLLGLAARQAAQSYEPASKASLQEHLARLARSRGEANAYARVSAEMVRHVAVLSRNEQLEQLIAAFAQRIGRYTRLGLASKERRARSLVNWRALAQAIMARTPIGAEAICRRLALENRDAALVAITRREGPVVASTPGRKSSDAKLPASDDAPAVRRPSMTRAGKSRRSGAEPSRARATRR